jgi:hypothetical protein
MQPDGRTCIGAGITRRRVSPNCFGRPQLHTRSRPAPAAGPRRPLAAAANCCSCRPTTTTNRDRSARDNATRRGRFVIARQKASAPKRWRSRAGAAGPGANSIKRVARARPAYLERRSCPPPLGGRVDVFQLLVAGQTVWERNAAKRSFRYPRIWLFGGSAESSGERTGGPVHVHRLPSTTARPAGRRWERERDPQTQPSKCRPAAV